MNAIQTARLCEQAEIDGWADMFRAPPRDFRDAVGMGVEVFADGVVGLRWRAVPIPLFNRVLGYGVLADATERLLDEITERYAAARIEQFALQICPAAADGQVLEWLRTRGFTRGGDWAKCIRGAAPAPQPATNLRIEPAGESERADYARTIGAAFGMPDTLQPFLHATVARQGWRSYLSYADREPVGCGALHISGAVGWLGGGGTIPAYRKRGGQGAMMARRIADGLGLGCTSFVTETGAERPEQPNPSFHNMIRSGFELAYLRTDWLSPKLV